MSYEPATSSEPLRVGRTDWPLVVLRSHPDFPNTLSEEVEGAWVDLNPAWPESTVKWFLDRLSPPCHTDWNDFDEERIEKKDDLTAHVVYVRPGPPEMSSPPEGET